MHLKWRKGQREVYEEMTKYLYNDKNILLIAPTGWGKILLILGRNPNHCYSKSIKGLWETSSIMACS